MSDPSSPAANANPPLSISDRIPPLPPGKWMGKKWHSRAWALWHLLPEIPTAGLAWLLGEREKTLEKTAQRQNWPSRLELRKKVRDKEQAGRVATELKRPLDDIEYNPPPVSLARMIRVIERRAELEMERGNPAFMAGWLSNLASVDSAIRARAARRSAAQTRGAVRVYLPKQDAHDPEDDAIEEAQVIPPPVVF